MIYLVMSRKNEKVVPVFIDQNQVVTYQIDSVPKQVYDNLCQMMAIKDQRILELETENRDLRNNLDKLRSDNLTIEKNTKEIDILRAENAELKLQLKQLQSDVLKLTDQNETLQRNVDQLIEDKMMLSFLVALRDVTSDEELEKKLSGPHNRNLSRLRKNCKSECHYIVTEGDYVDSSNLIYYKKQILRGKLGSLSTSMCDRFERKYGRGFLGEIVNYLGLLSSPRYYVRPSEKDCEDVESWFEDYLGFT
jgi:hypothetical protein